eukprot:CAMPEP_0194210234 /NCGR_PEP_ID=MMETSP0156-20130528/8108_1 /TAXON_ID=33649 /ORGANISM="Thalassionema nitzschioides, Strain L26-B" /LENGTH=366 /DNA_ID=CAMNT_0038937557 /DNA_START=33 /DNA_END=1130 /DNA_ORIENTATION=-
MAALRWLLVLFIFISCTSNIYRGFQFDKYLQEEDAVDPSCEKKCALLFFGLVKEYRELILPSIRRNILELNPHCDIFLHTYNLTNIPISDRSGETEESPLAVDEAYLLTENVTMDTLSEFWAKRGKMVNYTQQYRHKAWGLCPPCTSHNNMIMQWHSIQSVWDLMVQHEQKIISGKDLKNQDNDASLDYREKHYYYEQIGLFRSDVYYPWPISIFEHSAGVPEFASNAGYNDRLFYGERKYASVWADRFAFVDIFIRKYMHTWIFTGHQGFHSETYLGALLKSHQVPVHQNSETCVWRVRSGMRLSVNDCYQPGGYFHSTDMSLGVYLQHLPVGYELAKVGSTAIGGLFKAIPRVQDAGINYNLTW